MYVDIGGSKLFFDIISSGLELHPDGDREKPVLFVHHGGPGGDHGSFRPYLDVLGEVAQVVYIDHRGTGRSEDAAPETYTVAQMADDLETLRQHLGFGRIMLLGHSFGGMVAQSYALRHPESLEGLILSNTAPDWGFWADARQNAERVATPEQQELVETLFSGGISSQEEYREWKAKCMPLYYRAPRTGALSAIAGRATGRYEVTSHMMANELPGFSVLDDLHRITAPTLVMTGAYDWVTPPSQAERIAARIPNADYVLFEESGHPMFADQEADRYPRDHRAVHRRGPLVSPTTPQARTGEANA